MQHVLRIAAFYQSDVQALKQPKESDWSTCFRLFTVGTKISRMKPNQCPIDACMFITT